MSKLHADFRTLVGFLKLSLSLSLSICFSPLTLELQLIPCSLRLLVGHLSLSLLGLSYGLYKLNYFNDDKGQDVHHKLLNCLRQNGAHVISLSDCFIVPSPLIGGALSDAFV